MVNNFYIQSYFGDWGLGQSPIPNPQENKFILKVYKINQNFK